MEQTALISVSSRSIGRLLESILTRMGYAVRNTRRYYDVIAESKAPTTGLIVISDSVGNRDGYDLARRIKNFDANNTKRVIVVNINRRNADARTLERQLIYPLTVPFREEDIRNIIQRTARRRRSIAAAKDKQVAVFSPKKESASSLEAMLRAEHFRAYAVTSLATFRERVTSRRPDAVIIDADSVRREAYALARELRTQKQYTQIPIMFVTGRDILHEHVRGFDNGITDYLRKPADGRRLFDRLTVLFDNIASPGKAVTLAVSIDPSVRHTIAYTLAKNRFAFRTAGSVDEAMRALRSQRIDAVVADLESDRMKILPLIGAIRRNHKYDDVSIMTIVERETIGLIDTESSAGITDYLLMPFDETPFIRRLRNNLIMKNVIDSIEYQNKQLMLVNKRHNDLLTFTGYDIKGPLSLIRNYTKFCLEKPELPREEIVRSVNAIDRQARLATRIIDTTMHYKSIETGRISLEKTDEDVVELLNRCIEDNMIFMENRGLKLRVEVRDVIPPMRIDKLKIYEVFNNLLHNSVKHSAQGGSIVVTVGLLDYQDEFYSLFSELGEAGKRLNKFVEIRFMDEGRSLNDRVQSRIFDLIIKNTQGQNDDKNLNIALYIVKAFVGAHGGKVWVESETEGGNAFIILLPVS
ncbi:MAG: response regulator [Spirochaetota bacterium]